jgi:hypothetical protein
LPRLVAKLLSRQERERVVVAAALAVLEPLWAQTPAGARVAAAVPLPTTPMKPTVIFGPVIALLDLPVCPSRCVHGQRA